MAKLAGALLHHSKDNPLLGRVLPPTEICRHLRGRRPERARQRNLTRLEHRLDRAITHSCPPDIANESSGIDIALLGGRYPDVLKLLAQIPVRFQAALKLDRFKRSSDRGVR